MPLLACALALIVGSALPPKGKEGPAAPSTRAVPAGKPRAPRAPGVHPVQLNTASKAELMKLPGIHESSADRIIAGRPYLTKTNLVTRKILSLETYLSIKHRISARQAPSSK